MAMKAHLMKKIESFELWINIWGKIKQINIIAELHIVNERYDIKAITGYHAEWMRRLKESSIHGCEISQMCERLQEIENFLKM